MRSLQNVRIFVVAAVAVATCLAATSLDACSRILWNTSKQGVYSSRSADWHENIVPELCVYPRGMPGIGGIDDNAASWTSKYGSACIVGENYDHVAMDGLNERGLAAHVLYLDDANYGERDDRPGVSYVLWLRYVLDNFATVKEAVAGLNDVQIVPVPIKGRQFGLHMAIEDASGDSAIFEHLDGKLVVHHGREYAVMCNEPAYDQQLADERQYAGLGGDKELPGGVESSDRFARASYFLKYLPEPADDAVGISYALQLIRNVSVPFGAPYKTGIGAGTYPTWWVTAIDLKNKRYYFSATENPNVIWLDLSSLDLTPGRPVRTIGLDAPALVGEISPLLRVGP